MLSLRSKLTQKVLAHLFLQEQEFYASELARRLDLDRGNLIKKLHEMEREGLLTSEARGRERFYHLNKSYSLLSEYKNIVRRTIGLEHQLKLCLEQVEGIESATLFGSYVEDKMDAASDIDLLVVGDHNALELQRALTKLQKTMDREINAIQMSPSEFSAKKGKDPFLKAVFRKPHNQIL